VNPATPKYETYPPGKLVRAIEVLQAPQAQPGGEIERGSHTKNKFRLV